MDARKNASKAAHKLPYSLPKLKEFGPVGSLTQGGSAGATETGVGMMNPNQMA